LKKFIFLKKKEIEEKNYKKLHLLKCIKIEGKNGQTEPKKKNLVRKIKIYRKRKQEIYFF
jgi:hypothetical protein